MPEPTDDKGTDDKGTEGAPPNGNSAPGNTGPADDDKGTEGEPNGRAPGRPKDDDADWKSRARQHEDTSKARKKDLDAALADRDKLSGVLDGLRKALDPDGDKSADPAELAKQATSERDQAKAEVRLARVELAAERAARKAGADVDALLDSRTFLTRLADLDPTDDGFAAAVETAVREAVKERPSLKSNTAPPRSGNADMTSGGGAGTGQLTRADLKNMSPQAIEKARSDGRLKTLLGG